MFIGVVVNICEHLQSVLSELEQESEREIGGRKFPCKTSLAITMIFISQWVLTSLKNVGDSTIELPSTLIFFSHFGSFLFSSCVNAQIPLGCTFGWA